MSEKTIALGIRKIIRTIAGVEFDSVSISNWSMLDSSLDQSPFIRIDVAENFEAAMGTRSPVTQWEIPVTILVAFKDWEESTLVFRDVRQSIIDKFNEIGTNRSAGGIDGVDIKLLRATTGVEPVFPEYDEYEDPDPVFLTQVIIFEIEEMGE